MTALARSLSRHFGATVRHRGTDYYRGGRVKILQGTESYVEAVVRGTERYEVELRRDHDEIRVSCTCPYFDTNPCKHIWASILATDAEQWLRGDGRGGDVRLAYAGEPFFADDELYESPDDEIVESQRRLNASRREAASSSPSKKNWRSQLKRLRDAESPSPLHGVWPATRELLYVVDVAAAVGSRGLWLEIWSSDLKKDGTRGKPKMRGLPRGLLDGLPDADDRYILAFLAGATELYGSYSYFSRGTMDYGTYPARYRLVDPQPELLLPAICRTGRCRLRRSADDDVRDWLPVTWDDGEPWQFRLEVRLEEGDQEYRLSGILQRGAERMPLATPVGLTSGGLLFMRDRIACFDAGESSEWAALLREQGALRIPHAARHDLIAELMQQAALPPLDLPADLRYEEVNCTPRPRLTVRPAPFYRRADRVNGVVEFDYGDMTVPCEPKTRAVVQAAARRLMLRDLTAERDAIAALVELGWKPASSGYSTAERAVTFELPDRRLAATVRELVTAGWYVEAEGKVFRTAGAFDVTVASGIDWFELRGDLAFGDGGSAHLPELLAAVRKGEDRVALGDGSIGLIPEEWLARYGLLAGLGTAQGDHVRFGRTQVGLLDALLAAEPQATCDETFERARSEILRFKGVEPAEPSAGFQGELRPYQKEGLGWLHFLREFGFGGCLADDMGLGKTVQVLALLEARRAQRVGRPTLVVVPRSLIFNWQREAARFTPRLRVLDYTGTARRGQTETFADYDVVLTTYGTLRADVTVLKGLRFDYVILDEAQAIKNAASASAKAARLLKADHRLALSGTPVENRLSELWSLFEFLNPGVLGSASVFKTLSTSATGSDEAGRRMLAHALRPFLLRRTKTEVLQELPPKVEQTLYCELEPKQRKLYDELRDHYRAALLKRIDRDGINRAKIQILEALLRLRQAAIHPGLIDEARGEEPSAKLEILLPRLRELRDEGHKTLVFSQFTSMLALLRRHLDEAEVPYESLDGKTKNREERVARFQNEADCRLFLVSLKAGGLGLNLTAAQYVFLLDPWWNPAVESQAIDRAHRMGQTKHVFAYRLIARDTIEDKILELQNDKRELADAIVNADNGLIRTLSRDDLALLLS